MSDQPPPVPAQISRLPILYSALVYPGSGQFMMGRPVMGLAFAACFTIALAVFLVFFVRYLRDAVEFLRICWSGRYSGTEAAPSLRPLLMPFVYLLLVYLANLYDVIWRLYRPHLERQAKAGNKAE